MFVLTTGAVTESQPSDWEDISMVYYGGHRTSITAAEAAVLTSAGYGAYIEA